ncbi:hypothetical protein Q8F55_008994 [Vanrija albida]|uniref:Major facilitator superfamily (MFS) profile domain-containing protein n=1 Tax=Vanrija albida TaxID=181172 RepID=A0ABR3PTC0_9TREE
MSAADLPPTHPDRRAVERRLLWKVDLILMPILTITLGLQYYDKAALSSAAAFGILKDLGLATTHNGVTSTARYATASAAFYYGYIVAVLPVALVLTRLNLRYAAAAAVVTWGLVAILTVVCHNHQGLIVQRVALGLAESVVAPLFVAITALWYKPQEQAVRFGIWYSATGIFSMFNGAINYGLGSNGNAHAWKYIYYFCGSVTIAWGFVILAILPTSPLEPGFFFTAADRDLLVRRFEENPYARDRQTFKRDQFIEAVVDIKTWIYLFIACMCYMCNGAVTAFGTLIIKSIGYTGLQSVALTIPGGFVTVVTIFFFSYFADKYKNIRTYLLPLSCIPVVVGAIVIWTVNWHPAIGPLMGYYLVASFGAPYVLLLAIASANTAGSTKKAVTSGAIFVGYNVGNIAASYTVKTPEAKVKYRTTWITVIVSMAAASIASLVLRWLLVQENKRRDALVVKEAPAAGGEKADAPRADDGASDDAQVIKALDEYADVTDKHLPSFRYTL